jgi:hypothetical protein
MSHLARVWHLYESRKYESSPERGVPGTKGKMTMMQSLICTILMAGVCFAASRPVTDLKGSYVEARTADVFTGPCFANSEVELVGNLAVFGWRIEQGQMEGVKLDGLSVVAAVKARSTLGNQFGTAYPVKSYLIVDQKASIEQRAALERFARRMGGDLLEDVAGIASMPIEFMVEGDSIHDARVSLTAGTLAAVRTRAIHSGDHICSNEETWYPPLTKLDHSMAAYTLDHRFNGTADKALNGSWWNPEKRSAFVGTFHLAD